MSTIRGQVPPSLWESALVSVLVVVSGLPATGKTTVCAQLAAARRGAWLRVDRIEDAIVRTTSLRHPVGVVGYEVAYALAEEQLHYGIDVIAECVNPVAGSRDAWRRVAENTDACLSEVEMICSDPDEHRHRAETRTTDIEGLPLPTWADILAREYEPWIREHLVIDSATTSPHEAAEQIASLAWSDPPTGSARK